MTTARSEGGRVEVDGGSATMTMSLRKRMRQPRAPGWDRGRQVVAAVRQFLCDNRARESTRSKIC
jgi:hypothetical protein